MTTFGERLAAAKSKAVPYSDVSVTLDDETVETFRFHRLSGRAWAAVCAKNPLRIEVPLDRQYGYNYQGACEDAASQAGFHLDGGVETKLEVQEWIDLFETISGSEYVSIADAIWALNEWEPAQRLDALKKRSAVATALDENLRSASKSAARRKSSMGGSPRSSRSTTTTTKAG